MERFLNRAFLAYVADGNIAEVKNILECNININATDDSGNTALIIACGDSSDKELIKLLIDEGINLDTKNKMGNTALILACRFSSNEEILLLLINSKVNLNLQNNKGYSAYKIAQLNYNCNICEALVKAGAVIT